MSVESKSAADASIGELMTRLSSQTSRLVRDEIQLAQKEFRESAKRAGIGAGLFSGAGVFAVLGLASFVAAAIAALSLVLPARVKPNRSPRRCSACAPARLATAIDFWRPDTPAAIIVLWPRCATR